MGQTLEILADIRGLSPEDSLSPPPPPPRCPGAKKEMQIRPTLQPPPRHRIVLQMKNYQHTLPPPPKQTPTYPCSRSSTTFILVKKPDTKESISISHPLQDFPSQNPWSLLEYSH